MKGLLLALIGLTVILLSIVNGEQNKCPAAPHSKPPHVGNEKRWGMPRRKEYRQMTKAEMNRFHKCMNSLKKTGIYDKLVKQHTYARAPAANLGAAFLPWHRHYLYIMVQALRKQPSCKYVFIPYWDCTLDEPLPSPHHVVQWQDKFWGNNEGKVTSGRLGKRWSITMGCEYIGDVLRRDVNNIYMGSCDRQHILQVLKAKSYAKLMAYRGQFMSEFELIPASMNCFVGNCPKRGGCGGHISCVECAPSDPIFFLVYSFVDCLWYEWANLPQRDNTYPIINVPGGLPHAATSPMNPFKGLQNQDGFSDPEYSHCTPRPGRKGFTCGDDRDCKSPLGLLWCSNKCECVSKVREGGNCKGLPDRACYCRKGPGHCKGGRCHC